MPRDPPPATQNPASFMAPRARVRLETRADGDPLDRPGASAGDGVRERRGVPTGQDEARHARCVGHSDDGSEILWILDPVERDERRTRRLRLDEERLQLHLGEWPRLEPDPRGGDPAESDGAAPPSTTRTPASRASACELGPLGCAAPHQDGAGRAPADARAEPREPGGVPCSAPGSAARGREWKRGFVRDKALSRSRRAYTRARARSPRSDQSAARSLSSPSR